MPAKQTDRAAKAADLLLGKVRGLSWHYHEVNFSAIDEAGLLRADRTVLDRIEFRDRHFVWRQKIAPSSTELFLIVAAEMKENRDLAEEIYRRIFDLEDIPNKSEAEKGLIGFFNRGDRRRRNRRYRKRVRSEICRGERCVIVAEGDSWFQYPSFGLGPFRMDAVRDIVDHLSERRNLYVRSLASGGDWLSNMLRTREYIPELSRIEPHVLLFSGGGNDILGNGRVANMVKHLRREGFLEDGSGIHGAEELAALGKRRGDEVTLRHPDFDPARYMAGLMLLDDEFFALMNLITVQYFLFFFNLGQARKLKRMRILTQGYDYALPRKARGRWWQLRHWINRATGSGKWLWEPMEVKALDDERKRAAIYTMITEFNELLLGLAHTPLFPNVYHIDNRGVATSADDWFDEIHLRSEAFGRVADRIVNAIAAIDQERKNQLPRGEQTRVFQTADVTPVRVSGV